MFKKGGMTISTEQRVLQLTRSKIPYKLLNIHIIIRKIIYGREHNKTKMLIHKRNVIDGQAIQDFRNLQRYYQVMRGEVDLLNGKKLEKAKELNKLLDEKGKL